MTYSPGWTLKSASATSAQAFDTFRQNLVDLNRNKVKKARQSRVYLQEQLVTIAKDYPDFPPVTSNFMPFGSFARRTKVRPLDDNDMLVMLNGQDSQVWQSSWDAYTFQVNITTDFSPLKPYIDEYGWVNSTKILNRFKSGLKKVPNYQKSEIKRTGVAVVLNLKSYEWAFDIVPALPVENGGESILHYLIPDGRGNWTRTDPRIDQELMTEANRNQNGYLLPLIRLIKYWNVKSRAAPKLKSYHLETLLINAFRYGYPEISSSIRWSVPEAFRKLASGVMYTCPDPKGLGPNLDTDIAWHTSEKIRDAANKPSSVRYICTALRTTGRSSRSHKVVELCLPPTLNSNITKEISVQRLMAAQFAEAKQWWFRANVSRILVVIITTVSLLWKGQPEWIWILPALLTATYAVLQWHADAIQGKAEVVRRKFDFQNGLGWKISEQEKAEMLNEASRAVKKAAYGPEESPYYDSQEPVSFRRAVENLRQSAWYTNHQAKEMSKWVFAVSTIIFVLAGVSMVVVLQSSPLQRWGPTIGRTIVTVLVFLLANGIHSSRLPVSIAFSAG